MEHVCSGHDGLVHIKQIPWVDETVVISRSRGLMMMKKGVVGFMGFKDPIAAVDVVEDLSQRLQSLAELFHLSLQD